MSINNRGEMILQYLRDNNRFVTVEQLGEALFVSGATIRRDLAELEASRLIRRVRGGAILIDSQEGEDPINFRENRNVMQKQIIAGMALTHIEDGMTLFLDSSSTALALARRLDTFSNLCVVTYGLKTANLLSDFKGVRVMCTGGTVRENTKSLVGRSTLNYLSRLNADLAFLSCRGFDLEGGATEASEEECDNKLAFLENSRESILLCDTSKYQQSFLLRIAPLARFRHVITEKPELNRQLERAVRAGADTNSKPLGGTQHGTL